MLTHIKNRIQKLSRPGVATLVAGSLLAALFALSTGALHANVAHASCDPRFPNITPPVISSMSNPHGTYQDPGNIPVTISGEGGYECSGPPNGGLGWEMVEVAVVYTITDAGGSDVYHGNWAAVSCHVPICVQRTISVNQNIDASSWPAGVYTITAQANGAGGESNVVTGTFTITRAPSSWLFSCSTAQQVVDAGSPATYSTSVTSQGGFAGAVNVAVVAGLPSGATATPDVANVPAGGTGGAMVIVNTSASSTGSTSTLTFRATAAGYPAQECQGNLIVRSRPATQVPAVTLSAVPSQVAPQGNTTLSWNIAQADATSCALSANPANAAWSGTISGTQTHIGSHVGPTISMLATTTFMISCSNENGSSESNAEVRISSGPTLVVSPRTRTVNVGSVAAFTAMYDQDGAGPAAPTEVTIPATWRTGDASIAAISSYGGFTGMQVGNVTISATYQGLTDNAALTVSGGPSSSPTLTIRPSTLTIAVDGSGTYSAAYDPDGSGSQVEQDVTQSASWSSESSAVAASSGNGVFRGVARGATSVSANHLGLRASAGLTVGAALGTCTLTANPTALFIPPLRSTSLAWSCDHPTSCVLSRVTPNPGQVAAGNETGSGQDRPASTTRYQLSCDNGDTVVEKTVRVFDVTTRIEILPL